MRLENVVIGKTSIKSYDVSHAMATLMKLPHLRGAFSFAFLLRRQFWRQAGTMRLCNVYMIVYYGYSDEIAVMKRYIHIRLADYDQATKHKCWTTNSSQYIFLYANIYCGSSNCCIDWFCGEGRTIACTELPHSLNESSTILGFRTLDLFTLKLKIERFFTKFQSH